MKRYYAVVRMYYEYQADIEVQDDVAEDDAENLAVEAAKKEFGGDCCVDTEILESGWR